MITQPTVSSMMAVETMTWPRLRRMKFISRTTIATILMEEIESAVPRNSAGTSRPPGMCGISESGRNSPSAKPQAKGSAMPASEIATAAPFILLHQLDVGLHAGQQQQHQDADLRQAIDHALSAPDRTER